MGLKDLENRKKFGKLVRQKRKAQGLTQKELARKARISISLMQLIEQGRTGPGHRGMFALAEVLRIPFDPESIAIKSREGNIMEGMEGVKKEVAVMRDQLGQLTESIEAIGQRIGPVENPDNPPGDLGRIIGQVDNLSKDVAALKEAQGSKEIEPEDPETPEDAVIELVQQYTGAGKGDGFGLLDSLFGSDKTEELKTDAYVDAYKLCEYFEIDPHGQVNLGWFDGDLAIADHIRDVLVKHATAEEPDAEKTEDKILEALSKHLPEADSRRERKGRPGRTGRREEEEDED